MPELDQPLMVVVVLRVFARATANAKAAGAVFCANGWAANIALNSSVIVFATVQRDGTFTQSPTHKLDDGAIYLLRAMACLFDHAPVFSAAAAFPV